MTGSYFPFSREVILKRYQDKAGYLTRIRSAAQKLVAEGFLLERDLPAVEQVSSREWDFVMADRPATSR